MASFQTFISIISDHDSPEPKQIIEILQALKNVDQLISNFESFEIPAQELSETLEHLRVDLADFATTVYYNLEPTENI